MTITSPCRARRRLLTVATVALALVVGACGDSDDDGGSNATAAGDTSESVSSASTTTSPPPQPYPFQVDVTLGEFRIEIPAQIPAGFVRISATNTGTMTHHLIMARIHDGTTYDQWVQAFTANEFAAEGLLEFYGGPNGVNPGETVSSAINLPAGTYVALCLIPDAAGHSHASMGMYAPVTVTEGDEPVDLSTLGIEATVSLVEHDFVVSPGFDGQGRVLITNDGTEAHEIVITQVLEGGSFEEYRTALLTGGVARNPEVASKYHTSQGITVISPGVSIVAEIDLTEGDYVFVCFAPDLGDLLPHSLHGEVKLVHFPT